MSIGQFQGAVGALKMHVQYVLRYLQGMHNGGVDPLNPQWSHCCGGIPGAHLLRLAFTRKPTVFTLIEGGVDTYPELHLQSPR